MRYPTYLMLSLLLAGAHTSAAETAAIDGLGVLPGRTQSYAFAVSDDGGTVVGGSSTFRSYPTAFVWHSASGITPLPALANHDDRGLAQSISADGSTIVGSSSDAAGTSVPVRWSQGQVNPLPLPVPGSIIAPLGSPGLSVVISADGTTVAGIEYGADGSFRVLRWRQGAPETLAVGGGTYGISISTNGNDGLILNPRADVFRWHDGLGLVKTRISPSVFDGYTHEPWVATMAANGSRFFVWTYGNSPLMRSIYEWKGLNDGAPMAGSYSTAGHALGRLATTASGNLLGLTSLNDALLTNDTVLVVPPYGPLPLGNLLRAQGASTAHWSALTNITAFSNDGHWVVGSGIAVANDIIPAHEEAFRAQLVLHATGDPALRVTTVTAPASNLATTELRWPATDLLVAVESVPALHPDVPWQTEVGTPRLEGGEIVLRLYDSTMPRFFRLRRLD